MSATHASVWDQVVGQEHAVSQLRASATEPVHAYLFLGPSGSTKEQAARAFAARLLSGSDDASARDARLVLAGEHPDVREVQRAAATISTEQIREIVRLAAMAPVEGIRQVIILHEFHLLTAMGAAALLKTIEEPPPSTIFIVLADMMTTDLVTIASRCARVDFRALNASTIAQVLVTEGTDPTRAELAAVAAAGNLRRARVLVADPELERRRQAFADVPRRLDGTGAMVVRLTAELFGLIESAAEPLTQRQAAEAAELDERIKMVGERGGGRKQLEDRHKREQRRHRVDELRSGLATMAGTYRDALVARTAARAEGPVSAVSRIHQSIAALERNPNETLLIQALLLDLPTLD
ncbi:MAG TPA: hypothetical protein PKV27_01070 [Ilumatobacteraceae bacterium]|nr:hypothetical protein [Ilumatobacteraceae bacterium]